MLEGLGGDYLCKCEDGFVGDDCGLVNPCLNVTCENEGECSVTILSDTATAKCICKNGYEYASFMPYKLLDYFIYYKTLHKYSSILGA